MSKDEYAKQLHRPGRADHMESLETHLNEAAGLARALWRASEADDVFLDERDRDAFLRLASALADHASAALYAFNKDGGVE